MNSVICSQYFYGILLVDNHGGLPFISNLIDEKRILFFKFTFQLQLIYNNIIVSGVQHSN